MPGTAAVVTEPAKMKSRRVWDGLDGIFCSECLKEIWDIPVTSNMSRKIMQGLLVESQRLIEGRVRRDYCHRGSAWTPWCACRREGGNYCMTC